MWLPYLANVIGARPPFHVPEWPHRRRPTGRAHDDEYQRIFQLEKPNAFSVGNLSIRVGGRRFAHKPNLGTIETVIPLLIRSHLHGNVIVVPYSRWGRALSIPRKR